MTTGAFDVSAVRSRFPALSRLHEGRHVVHFDGPGGTQTCKPAIDALVDYLSRCNANHGGVFAAARDSDAILDDAHGALADFLNAPSADEIAFGANMTSLTFSLSRAIGRTLRPGDQVVVTRLDHDANVTPWTLAARDAGAEFRFVDFHPEDGTLNLAGFEAALTTNTRLVAVGLASNALGTVNDVKTLVAGAKTVGAKVFVDAVHYAPHGPIDVQELGCDFLACSVYKFFGPHVGVLWGKTELMESLPAYKVRPAADTIPDRWMTGTQSHEGIAGAAAAVGYLADLGRKYGSRHADRWTHLSGRSRDVHRGLSAIREYETGLCKRMLTGLTGVPGLKLYGLTDPEKLAQRVPTFSFTMRGRTPRAVAEHLDRRGIFAWNGNFYAIQTCERLGLEGHGGLLRVGAVHYNTPEEIDRLIAALHELA